ncbi:SEC-C domain-containing protein [Methylovulum psychrotolerans]|nr:SEC-C domain-containing protein [Methylovulum psychrotolerans]
MPFHQQTPKIGRNELCPCESGKKYKNCLTNYVVTVLFSLK